MKIINATVLLVAHMKPPYPLNYLIHLLKYRMLIYLNIHKNTFEIER